MLVFYYFSNSFSIRLTVQTNPNNGGTNNDGDDFVFNLSNANITANSSGSPFGTFTSISSENGKNVLDVTATVLEFVQQPTDVGVNAVMNPYVTVRGKDANGNIDNGPLVVSITSDGTMDVSPKTASISNGLATFGNVIHTVVQTGRKLTASATGASSIVSSAFNILDVTTDNCLDLSKWANRLQGQYKFAVTVVNRFNYESKPATVSKRFK